MRGIIFLAITLHLASLIIAQNSCGISGKATGFIVNGTESKQGAWPWIASLHIAKDDSYQCGGSLIGSKIVLTVSKLSNRKFLFNFIFHRQLTVFTSKGLKIQFHLTNTS